MSKQFWGVIVGIVLIFVGIIALSGGGKSNNSGSGSSGKTLTQHVVGKGTTGVTIIEYGDYQCAYCQQYYPTVKQAQLQYGDKIKFQFRNFPLVSLHRNAFAASRAAEAAGMQNKYWEMHDVLYENNDPNGKAGWVAAPDPNTYFNAFAKQIGLNLAQFKTDFASSKVNDLINADLAEGTKLGITGTPTFYINGKKADLGNSIDSFTKVIDAAIAKQAPAAKPQ